MWLFRRIKSVEISWTNGNILFATLNKLETLHSPLQADAEIGKCVALTGLKSQAIVSIWFNRKPSVSCNKEDGFLCVDFLDFDLLRTELDHDPFNLGWSLNLNQFQLNTLVFLWEEESCYFPFFWNFLWRLFSAILFVETHTLCTSSLSCVTMLVIYMLLLLFSAPRYLHWIFVMVSTFRCPFLLFCLWEHIHYAPWIY